MKWIAKRKLAGEVGSRNISRKSGQIVTKLIISPTFYHTLAVKYLLIS